MNENRIAVASGLSWTYPDREIEMSGDLEYEIDTARGTYSGLQVLYRGPADEINLECTPVSGPGSEAGIAVDLFEAVDVPVERNTGVSGFIADEDRDITPYTTRTAPFRVFDALRPLENPLHPEQGRTLAVYTRFWVPRDCPTGSYRWEVTIETGGEHFAVPVQIRVYSALVPRSGRLKVTNWFNLENMASRHNLETWSEGHWSMIRRYARLMRRGRQNVFWVPLSLVDIESDGDRVRFDFSRAERLIRLFLDEGFEYIEGGHVATRRKFHDQRFILTFDRTLEATSPDGYRLLARFLREWHMFLKEHGWLERVVQHIGDEPIAESAADYRILAGMIRKFMPGVDLIDAIESWELGGAVDIWVPKNSYYEKNRDRFQEHRELGDEIWFYTCCIPGGGYMNRLLDMPLLRTCLLHWGNYLYDLGGYLHWGLNQYRSDQDPFNQSVVGHTGGNSLPAGDTHIVYPGENGPLSCLRFEAMCRGIEDYELLVQLGDRIGREKTVKMIRPLLRGFADFSEEPSEYSAVRKKVLTALDCS